MIKLIFNSESYLITEILFIEYTLRNPLKTNFRILIYHVRTSISLYILFIVA